MTFSCNHVCVALVARLRVYAFVMSKPITGNKPPAPAAAALENAEEKQEGSRLRSSKIRKINPVELRLSSRRRDAPD